MNMMGKPGGRVGYETTLIWASQDRVRQGWAGGESASWDLCGANERVQLLPAKAGRGKREGRGECGECGERRVVLILQLWQNCTRASHGSRQQRMDLPSASQRSSAAPPDAPGTLKTHHAARVPAPRLQGGLKVIQWWPEPHPSGRHSGVCSTTEYHEAGTTVLLWPLSWTSCPSDWVFAGTGGKVRLPFS